MVTHPELFTFRQAAATVDTAAGRAGSITTTTGQPIHLVDDIEIEQLRALIVARVRASLSHPDRRVHRPVN